MSRKNCPNKVSKKIKASCLTCGIVIYVYPSRVKIGKGRYCSKGCSAKSRKDILFPESNTINLGKKYTDEHKRNISKALKGKSCAARGNGKRGSECHNWKGGVTPINKKLRNSLEFKEWRKKVFERDNYTCQICEERGGVLHPDHIKQFAYYPSLRFELSNGRTLCAPCHMKTDTWGNRGNKLPTEQK